MDTAQPIDVHQHLVPPALEDALRRRGQPPLLDGDTLHRDGCAPAAFGPGHFDVEARVAQLEEDGCAKALISLSSPLGLEYLPPEEAWPLLDHHDKPLLIHPGPVSLPAGQLPAWWTAVVPFVAQQHAAWHAWHAWQVAGPQAHPDLRACFVALAGLAPLHGDRVRARGGSGFALTGNVYYETPSYRERTVALLQDNVAAGAIVYGSDRPYAQPSLTGLPASTSDAIRVANPGRLLTGPSRKPTHQEAWCQTRSG
ncbi:MAG: amidohydrolase [Actinophytocola sp.]|nr:amidohydrolase [Actinophytocola sp.]